MRNSTATPDFPCSLDPLPDESLPGFLLRLSHRLELAPIRIMQLTGLVDATSASTSAPQSMMARLDQARAERFAGTIRLTATEAAELCLDSMSDRYPWSAP